MRSDLLFLLVLTLIQAAYGGVHLVTLSFMFPSQTERLLWKIACCSLPEISGCVALFLIRTLWVFVAERKYFSRVFDKLPEFMGSVPLVRASKKNLTSPAVAGPPLSAALPPGRVLLVFKAAQRRVLDVLACIVVCVLVVLLYGMPLLFLWSRVYIVAESLLFRSVCIRHHISTSWEMFLICDCILPLHYIQIHCFYHL